MGRGNYLGGGTIFTYADLDWFGAGGVEVPREERKERIKKELIRQRQQGLPPNPTQRERELHEALQLSIVLDLIADRLADQPCVAPVRKPIDSNTEQRIAELKRDLAAFANQARNAVNMHEKLRQELRTLLAKHHIAEDTYPEARKLVL
ncbi:MAG: hypothetical protein ABGW87_12745 [Sphingomonadaceae bacterium]